MSTLGCVCGGLAMSERRRERRRREEEEEAREADYLCKLFELKRSQ